jgi:hypothetical protein
MLVHVSCMAKIYPHCYVSEGNRVTLLVTPTGSASQRRSETSGGFLVSSTCFTFLLPEEEHAKTFLIVYNALQIDYLNRLAFYGH